MDEAVECMIGDCQAAPVEVLVLADGGIMVRFAVCAAHAAGARAGAWLPAPASELRGFIGLQLG